MSSSTIFDVERIISTQPATDEVAGAARKVVRTILSQLIPNETTEGKSIAELIEEITINSESKKKREVAILLSRWLAIPGLLPSNNNYNHINRRICTLFETAVPDLAKEFSLSDKSQTHEKISIISGIHSSILTKLEVFQNLPHEQNAFLAIRRNLLTAVNNGLVKSYLGPFGFERTKTFVTAASSNLKDLIEDNGPSIGERYRDLKKFIDDELSYANDNPSPVTSVVLIPFCLVLESIAENFRKNARDRFKADIQSLIPASGTLDKKYPLHEVGRELTLRIPFQVIGKGFARTARAQIVPLNKPHRDASILLEKEEIALGDIASGPFSIFVDGMIVTPCVEDGFSFIVEITWTETASDDPPKSITCEVHVSAQPPDVDWDSIAYKRPYSTEVAKGPAFVGRSERVSRLANHLLRTPTESFFITGQKRVGKTSLALASVEYAKEHQFGAEIKDLYLLWGEIAHNDPLRTMQALGDELAELMSPFVPEQKFDFFNFEFSGSLAPLVKMAKSIAKFDPKKRFVILFDEFDEMHPDLYRQGTLAETFFANIRALTTCENVAFVLIGGENMPFVMDRQGQKLNKFIKEPLDYYSRDLEWSDYTALIRQPTGNLMYWHDQALAEVFNISNGNPYFTNHVCAQVLRIAVSQRDNDITLDEVEFAVSKELSTLDPNSFVHLWQDGALSTSDDAEAQIMRRRRVLVATARILRAGQPITLDAIVANKSSTKLSDVEVPAVVDDFCRRNILRNTGDSYEFVLPLFSSWLIQFGMEQLIADTLGDDIADSTQKAEDAAYVRVDEIENLIRTWPLYQGRRIGAEDVRGWLSQVESHRSQRLLFKILQGLHFYSEIEIRERLKEAHSLVKTYLPQFIQKKKSERRFDVAVTYIDGQGKSGSTYAALYAEMNQISSRNVLNPKVFSYDLLELEAQTKSTISAVVVVDDIAATGQGLSNNIERFVTENRDIFISRDVSLILIAITATAEGEQNVRKTIQSLSLDKADLRVCDPLGSDVFAFDKHSDLWESDEECERAKSMSIDIGSKIYSKSPLGYGGRALLVVFPDTCPNNSLPLLHSSAKNGGWKPLFPRLTN